MHIKFTKLWQLSWISVTILQAFTLGECVDLFLRTGPLQSGHIVWNYTCWDASCMEGLPKQNCLYQSTLTRLCFGSPNVQLASQHVWFYTLCFVPCDRIMQRAYCIDHPYWPWLLCHKCVHKHIYIQSLKNAFKKKYSKLFQRTFPNVSQKKSIFHWISETKYSSCKSECFFTCFWGLGIGHVTNWVSSCFCCICHNCWVSHPSSPGPINWDHLGLTWINSDRKKKYLIWGHHLKVKKPLKLSQIKKDMPCYISLFCQAVILYFKCQFLACPFAECGTPVISVVCFKVSKYWLWNILCTWFVAYVHSIIILWC